MLNIIFASDLLFAPPCLSINYNFGSKEPRRRAHLRDRHTGCCLFCDPNSWARTADWKQQYAYNRPNPCFSLGPDHKIVLRKLTIYKSLPRLVAAGRRPTSDAVGHKPPFVKIIPLSRICVPHVFAHGTRRTLSERPFSPPLLASLSPGYRKAHWRIGSQDRVLFSALTNHNCDFTPRCSGPRFSSILR
jgi:hypothetical protein